MALSRPCPSRGLTNDELLNLFRATQYGTRELTAHSERLSSISKSFKSSIGERVRRCCLPSLANVIGGSPYNNLRALCLDTSTTTARTLTISF
ncbi:unnamed protein product [Calypogeia fissa]